MIQIKNGLTDLKRKNQNKNPTYVILKLQFSASVLTDLRAHQHKGRGGPGINNKQEQNWRGHLGTNQPKHLETHFGPRVFLARLRADYL